MTCQDEIAAREMSTTGSQECFKEPRENCSISDALREHKENRLLFSRYSEGRLLFGSIQLQEYWQEGYLHNT